MTKSNLKSELTPEQRESHSAIVKAVLALVQMIISFFTSKKNSDTTSV